jgi:hypothetical protein
MTDQALDESPKQVSRSSLKWWQWVLMYPTLGISLFASIPTLLQYYQSHKLNVPVDNVHAAKRQDNLWAANLECTKQVRAETVTTQFNTQVSVTVCPKSGDVLVTVQPPDSPSPQVFRWIDVKALLKESSRLSAAFLLREAVAAEDKIVVAQAESVVCQRLAEGRLVRRVRDKNGNCFEEIINTYTGVLEKRTPAPCADSC